MEFKARLLILPVIVVFFLSACSLPPNRLPEPLSVSDNNVANGRRLIASYGCGSCHSIPGVPGADATVGPPLDRFYERSYIAGQVSNSWDNLIAWIQNPQQIKPGTAMPNLGVTQNEAFDIAAYLYHRPTLGSLLSH